MSNGQQPVKSGWDHAMDIAKAVAGVLLAAAFVWLFSLNSRLGDLSERLARIETKLDGMSKTHDGLEARFNVLEARFNAAVAKQLASITHEGTVVSSKGDYLVLEIQNGAKGKQAKFMITDKTILFDHGKTMSWKIGDFHPKKGTMMKIITGKDGSEILEARIE